LHEPGILAAHDLTDCYHLLLLSLQNDMVTTVVGSHSIGGYRSVNAPALTTCPFVPFDCTPSGQFQSAPFDNNVFKLACSGVKGLPDARATCAWNIACSDTSVVEGGCPLSMDVKAEYAKCSQGGSTSLPTPGLSSDVFLCRDNPETQALMVKYAEDQGFFFQKYKDAFQKMANLGWGPNDLRPL